MSGCRAKALEDVLPESGGLLRESPQIAVSGGEVGEVASRKLEKLCSLKQHCTRVFFEFVGYRLECHAISDRSQQKVLVFGTFRFPKLKFASRFFMNHELERAFH